MKLLIDEMYPPLLADLLRAAGIDAIGVRSLGLGGAPDREVFAAAQQAERAVLTENVADFTRLAAEYTAQGVPHAGLIVAVSARFSRRPAGLPVLVDALRAVADQDLASRVVFLQTAGG